MKNLRKVCLHGRFLISSCMRKAVVMTTGNGNVKWCEAVSIPNHELRHQLVRFISRILAMFFKEFVNFFWATGKSCRVKTCHPARIPFHWHFQIHLLSRLRLPLPEDKISEKPLNLSLTLCYAFRSKDDFFD